MGDLLFVPKQASISSKGITLATHSSRTSHCRGTIVDDQYQTENDSCCIVSCSLSHKFYHGHTS